MKNISKTIASISLSFLAFGAFGQSQNNLVNLKNGNQHPVSVSSLKAHHPKIAGSFTDSLNYNSSDSVQIIGIPITPVTIPSTARTGYNFSINMKVIGSKLDTVGIWYLSQAGTCSGSSGNFDITNARTTIGVHDGRSPNVNSWATGFDWFNGPAFSGTGAAVTWPETSGPYAGTCIGGNYIWYELIESGCTDTAYMPIQDIWMYASVTVNGGVNALVDYVLGDEEISGASTFVYWQPALYMNTKYTLADTGGCCGYSPFSSNSANANLLTNATVAIDTIWDAYSQGFITPITAGSLVVDTLWPALVYRNTSCENDTVIFQICGVNASGFPNLPQVYGADTLVLRGCNDAGINKINSPGFSVDQNYPNPFTTSTEITYNLVKASDVTFSVSDITGRVIVNNVYTNSAPGAHTINLSGTSFSPGVYFYTFNVNGSTITKKMVITE
jgi:hypothetical protein